MINLYSVIMVHSSTSAQYFGGLFWATLRAASHNFYQAIAISSYLKVWNNGGQTFQFIRMMKLLLKSLCVKNLVIMKKRHGINLITYSMMAIKRGFYAVSVPFATQEKQLNF